MTEEQQFIDRDLEQIKLLRVFHYVWSAAACLMGLAGVGYLILGIFVATHPDRHMDPVGPGLLFAAFGCLWFVVFETCAILSLVAARMYQRQRRYWWCFAAAVTCCVASPISLPLGIFAMIVLNRSSVKRLFRSSERQGEVRR
jgi:hypothetical protein